MNPDLTSYYKDRAKEYDKVYAIPEEQEDLRKATKIFQDLFAGKSVLEIACGTGYWTEQISKTAASILATDINKSVIDIAKSRDFSGSVNFEVTDMYSLSPSTSYSALFGGFIWSHILIQDLNDFLFKLGKYSKPGATIAFIDSKKVKGGYHDQVGFSRTDEFGNTYQSRKLENGTTHEVLKNFPSKEFLVQKLSTMAADIKYIDLDHYWIVIANVKF